MKYFLIISFFFIACQNKPSQTEQPSSEKTYFDLSKIVQSDIDVNTHIACGEIKTVSINGKTESKNLYSIDWKKEMQILLDCDLNKPSWKGKFNTQILDDHQKYVYTSTSTKIPVRQMTVNYEQKSGKLISVIIEKKISTMLFSNEQIITYYPDKSFKINAKQSALFMSDFNSDVEIKFIHGKI